MLFNFIVFAAISDQPHISFFEYGVLPKNLKVDENVFFKYFILGWKKKVLRKEA